MIVASQDIDPAAVLDLIVRHQQTPRTACAYLGTERSDAQDDLEGLDQHWLQTVRVSVADGRVVGAAVVEWDEDMDRSWIYGPWVEETRWREDAPALLRAVTAQAPVSGHELFASVDHLGMAWLAGTSGWRPGAVAYECARTLVPADVPGANGTSDVPGAPEVPGASEVADSPLGPDLRWATPADLPAIRALHDAEFPDTYARAEELIADGGSYRTVVLAAGGDVVGYATARTQGDDAVYLDFLAVRPDARRTGAGRRLLEGVQRGFGRPSMTLSVDENRPGSREFFAGAGFAVAAATRPYRP
ncbi:MAG: GNAT family N-acetyltransferase [Actinomycetaceae bacterium]